jgi:hypothetical protein
MPISNRVIISEYRNEEGLKGRKGIVAGNVVLRKEDVRGRRTSFCEPMIK